MEFDNTDIFSQEDFTLGECLYIAEMNIANEEISIELMNLSNDLQHQNQSNEGIRNYMNNIMDNIIALVLFFYNHVT